MDDVLAWAVFLGAFVGITAGCRWSARRLTPQPPDEEDPGAR